MANCPQCKRELNWDIPMKIEGRFHACKLCGHKELRDVKVPD